MQPDDYLPAVRAALGARGFEVSRAEVAGRSADVGRRADFRWSWLAVRLHTAVIVSSFGAAEARRELLDRHLASANAWAVAHRGGGRQGLQSGTAAITVVVLPDGPGEAMEWASHPHGHRFAAMAYPVAVDLRAGTVTQPQRLRIGRLFQGFLRGVVQDVVEAPLRA